MEREVFKIETIQLKYQPKIQAKGTQAKQAQNLKQTLRHTTNNIQHLEGTLSQQQEELQNVTEEIDETT